ncbi:MAG: hypothetical protein ACYCVL_03130 [Gemmatimonadaceae bacterium]
MRNSTILSIALPLAAALGACGRGDRTTSSTVDLQRDLRLASTTTMEVPEAPVNPANFNDLETRPLSAPRPSRRLRNDPGPRAVASSAPTLPAAPAPQVSQMQHAEAPRAAVSPVPLSAGDPMATLSRPAASSGAAGVMGSGDLGRTGSGGGMGPFTGVVIRGGGVGDDHCEPHGRGGVYLPMPGGFGGSRFPTIRPTVPNAH